MLHKIPCLCDAWWLSASVRIAAASLWSSLPFCEPRDRYNVDVVVSLSEAFPQPERPSVASAISQCLSIHAEGGHL